MKRWWRQSRPRLLSGVAFAIVRGIGRTLKIEVRGEENLPTGVSVIYSGWHGKSFIPAQVFYKKGVWALFSLSNDGELQSRIFRRLGFQILRGSTGASGPRAILSAVKVLKQPGTEMAITPDGPRGPAGVVQGGVVLMAQRSGAALVPVGSAAQRAWRAKSWDRYMFPKPFSKALMLFGEPLYVPAKPTDEEFEAARLELERRIRQLDDQAESEMMGSVDDRG